MPPSWVSSFHKQQNKATLRNGTTILFRSLDNPGRLAGLELDWFAIDEIGLIKEETFKMLQGRSKTSSIRKGIGAGNPAGPVHWTYEYFVKKARDNPDIYRLIQASSYENDYLHKDFTRDMEVSFGKDSVYYKQYVLGQFVAAEGAFWSNFNAAPYPTGHVIFISQIRDKIRGRGRGVRWGRVIDFGFEHPFVCLWYVTNGEWIIFFDEYVKRRGLIKQHCLAMQKKEALHQQLFGLHHYGVAWTDHEAVSRAEIAAAKDEDGKSIGFDCIPVEKKVMEGILLVQGLFGHQKLLIANTCIRTLQEIPSYHSKGGVVGEEPEREDEDACCCIRYACWAEMRHSIPYQRYKDMNYELTGDASDIESIDADLY